MFATKKLSISVGTLGVLALASSAGALAQSANAPSTRADLLEEEREAKSHEVRKPDRSSADRGLHWWDNQDVVTRVLSGWRGFHVATGSFASGAGLVFGVGYRDLAVGSVYPDDDLKNRVDVDVGAAYSLRNYSLGRARVTLKNIGGAPLNVAVWGRLYEFPEEDFFGIGPDSIEEDRTSYQMNSSEFGTDVSWFPGAGFNLSAGAAYLNPRIGPGEDPRFPSTEEIFDPATIPGFQAQPDFLRLNGGVSFDYRDNAFLPRSGGFYRISYFDYQDRDLSTYDFRQLHGDLEQYVPLGHKFRVLAFRASTVISDADAGQEVPFYHQPTLGGGERLRGFREFRFRDENSILFTAEYRWQAWWALDMALFVDTGKVAHDRSDLDLNDLETTYGLGFRFHSNDSFVGRLDLAFSPEGFIPLLRFVYVF